MSNKDHWSKSEGVSMPQELWKAVKKTAAEMGIGKSAFIRIAVTDYLKDEGKPSNGVKPTAA